MKYFRLVIMTLYIALFAYMGLSSIYGDTGYFAYKELDHYKVRLMENIKNLQDINVNLEKECNILKNKEQIMLQARNLGIIAKNEKIIIFDDNAYTNTFYSLGSLCKSNIEGKNRIVSITKIRVISIMIALIFSIFNFIVFINENDYKNRSKRHYKHCITNSVE